MSHAQLDLSSDELLSTTRAVRKRLDFDRPVAIETLEECLKTRHTSAYWIKLAGMAICICHRPGKKSSDWRAVRPGL